MKKIIGILILVFVCSLTTESLAQILGIRGGLNFSNVMMKDDEEVLSEDFKTKAGIHAGITAEFPLSESISFETGVLASVKGFRMSEEETYMGVTASYKASSNPIYVEVPLTLKLYFDLGGARLFGKVGPYAGLGLAGNYKTEFTYEGDTESESDKIEWGSDDDADYSRLDYGLLLGAGLDLGFIEVGASYGYGLANILAGDSGDYKAGNRVLGIYAGIKFGGR